MPLIICPKTTERVIKAFTEALELKKVPKYEAKFWHGNFNNFYYWSPLGNLNTHVLFTGYSGAVVGQAIIEYVENHIGYDLRQEIYFVGSVFAFGYSDLELGDIIIAEKAFSPDSFEAAIYKNIYARNIKNPEIPDVELLKRVIKIAGTKKLELKKGKVYCRISPGFLPEFNKPCQLMNEAMWWKFALANPENSSYYDYNCGEYESAAVYATASLLNIPAIALLDVKDKRTLGGYFVADDETKKSALNNILKIIREMLLTD